ncbi:MAG: hypothetical protein JXR25_10755 [Pontiellaceae bacterium]|nr:hypothetical protein [Pontiellaceae bacterium]MBN2785300.1 hypothetical protein [Pontiellaceae bacterium]
MNTKSNVSLIGLLSAILAATALFSSGAALAEAEIACDFNELSIGKIDGQEGWDVYEKVKDSASFSLVAGVGTTEEAIDHALVIKASKDSIRVVTDTPVRWLRRQTLSIEFDFRVAVPDSARSKPGPALSVMLGNTVLSENCRWQINLDPTTNSTWRLFAALPDPATVELPAEAMNFTRGDEVRISDWLHCRISILKQEDIDSFKSTVELFDRTGARITAIECSDSTKDQVTKSMWSLSRVHAGFMASDQMDGLICIDNFFLRTDP